MSKKTVIRMHEDATGLTPVPDPSYLARYNPDDGPNGRVEMCADPVRALHFAEAASAAACWQRQSRTTPLRPDGKPNRPLTRFTISFETIDEI